MVGGALGATLAIGSWAGPRPAPTDAAATTRQAEAPTVGFVGDSIALQAFRPIGTLLTRDRRIAFGRAGLGFGVSDVMRQVRTAVRGPDAPDIFLVLLGTAQSHQDSPAVWERQLRRLLNEVSPRVDCLRVFEINDDRTGFYRHHDRNAGAYNRITRRLTNRYANAEWYHYERWAELAGPDLQRPDRLHHTLKGQYQVAVLMRHAANSCDPARHSGPFWDVPDDHPAAAEIAWIGEAGLFRGYPNGTYRHAIGSFVQDATRGALLDMLWRLEGRPDGFGAHPWAERGTPYEAALRWAAATGIGQGFPDGRYQPEAPATRMQALALLYRLAAPATDHPDDPWSDAGGRAVRWAAAMDLFPGRTGATLEPGRVLTRAGLAQLVFRFAHLPPGPTTPAPVATLPPATTAVDPNGG